MHVLIVDGLNLIRRVFAAIAGSGGAAPGADRVSEACVSSLVRVIRRQQPSHALCVIDSETPSWRHEIFPPYKANREPMPQSLREALPAVIEAFEALGVRSIDRPGFEADDVIAACATKIAGSGGRVTIVSTDKSFCQILQDGIRVYDHFSDRYLDRDYVLLRFDVEPESLPTLFALTGNTSVNVPGVRSVGLRTAASLIHEHGRLGDILKAAESMKGHTGAMLRADREQARMAMRLLSLRTDLDLGLNLREFRLPSDQGG